MKKIFISFLIIIISLLPVVNCFANTEWYSISNNENIKYSLSDDTKELRIIGNGEIIDNIKSPFESLDFSRVIIEDGITSIGKRTFYNCDSLQIVEIGKDVEYISLNAFNGCDNLFWYTVSENNSIYESKNGLLYIKNGPLLLTPPNYKAVLDNNAENTGTENSLNNTTVKVEETTEHKHHYRGIKIEQTCASFGYTLYTCDLCGKEHKSNWYAPNRHEMVTQTFPATFETNGSRVTFCVNCGYVEKEEVIESIESCIISRNSFVYSKHSFTPRIIVADKQGNVLVKDVDYTYKLPLGRKNVGLYKYNILFTGKYSGSKELSFLIYPMMSYLKRIIIMNEDIKVEWEKVNSQCDGYVFAYSNNNDFTINPKYIYIKGKSKCNVKIKVQPKTKYYFKVRTYKVVGNKTYFSDWSKAYSATSV